MLNTYEQAITQVFKDEGGYTNDPKDPGGPTNWGITIYDAKHYWKADATAEDVKDMPKSIAEAIYAKHYADPIAYASLPAGVDYAVLDYAINSGIARAVRCLQSIVGAVEDGLVGPNTISCVNSRSSTDIINSVYDQRLAFLKSLSTWSHFQHGWTDRCTNGRKLAFSLVQQYKGQTMTSNIGTTIVTDIQDVTKAIQAVETVLPTVISIVGTFYAPINLITPFLPLIQEALTAVNTVATQSGTDVAKAIQDVVDTLTPGKPNAPALS